MLARVTTSMRPGGRRKSGMSSGGAELAAPLRADAPSASAPTPLPFAAAALDGGATVTVSGNGEGGGARELQGKPAAVIRGFVAESNIDLLLVPVPPPSTLKRLDPRNMRGAPPAPHARFTRAALARARRDAVAARADQRREASKAMYQKAACTCLCVPAHLLSDPAAAASAAHDGLGVMFSSEDEGDDEWRGGIRSPRRAGPPPAAPSSPRSTLTTQAMCAACSATRPPPLRAAARDGTHADQRCHGLSRAHCMQ